MAELHPDHAPMHDAAAAVRALEVVLPVDDSLRLAAQAFALACDRRLGYRVQPVEQDRPLAPVLQLVRPED